MASIGALVGHDETSRFEEATRLGILPGYGQYQAVFMALIPREQKPNVGYSLELWTYINFIIFGIAACVSGASN